MSFDDVTDGSKSSILDKIRFSFRVLGSILSLMNLLGLILYDMKHEFASHSLFDSFTAFVVLRICIILVLTLFFIFKNLVRHEVD